MFRSSQVAILCIVVTAVCARPAFASTYGYGKYGANIYGIGTYPSVTPTPGIPPVGCTQTAPATAPWLYGAVPTNSFSILLYFTDAADPVDHYALEYGYAPGDYRFSATDIGGKGMRTYTVSSLLPMTTYYFRVRGGNGCATGPWSNELSAKTSALAAPSLLTTPLQTHELLLQTDAVPTSSPVPSTKKTIPSSYTLNLRILTTQQNPLVDANVAIDESDTIQTTDQKGLVQFENLSPGEHIVSIEYERQTTRSHISLAGENKEVSLDLIVETPTKKSPSNLVLPIGIGLLVLLILVGIFFRFLSSRKKKDATKIMI